MEVRVSSGKAINFAKSSGGKEEESRLRKLDTSIEISGKNYAQEKSFPRLKTITRAEFPRRKPSFEAPEFRGGRRRTNNRTKIHEDKKRGENFCRRFRSLENLSSDECRARELEMSRKLREIHEMVQKMEKSAQEEKRKKTGKAHLEWRSKAKAPGGKTFWPEESPRFESGCNLNRKLVPIQFSTSFVTELGSHRKSFSEKILFKSVFVPSGVEEKMGKVFRSTLQVLCRPETEVEVKKAFVFL